MEPGQAQTFSDGLKVDSLGFFLALSSRVSGLGLVQMFANLV